MVKTITQADSSFFERKPNRKKCKNEDHPLGKLKKKALLLGGPYDIKLPRMNRLSVKVNLSKKKL